MQISKAERNGFVLAELLVAIVLFSIVAAAISLTMWRQSRAARAATELTQLRDHLNEGASIMASHLRSISSVGGDIYPAAMGKSSVEIRATFGTSFACGLAGNAILLPPNTPLSNGTRLSNVYKRVDPGHGVLVFDEGASEDVSDDSWAFRTITAVALPAGTCGGSPYVPVADGTVPGYVLTLDAALPPGVAPGAPVRIVERVRYALYRSADNKWYLGSCESNSMQSACTTLQPLVGPFLPPNPDQASGLSGLDLTYYNAAGLQTSDRFAVARIEIALRAETPGKLPLSGSFASATARDTLRLVVELRNQ